MTRRVKPFLSSLSFFLLFSFPILSLANNLIVLHQLLARVYGVLDQCKAVTPTRQSSGEPPANVVAPANLRQQNRFTQPIFEDIERASTENKLQRCDLQVYFVWRHLVQSNKSYY